MRRVGLRRGGITAVLVFARPDA